MTISLVAAVTKDGFIGRESDDRSFDWTSEEDSRFYVDFIKKADVIIMGARTFRNIKRHPRGANYVIYSSNPEKFVNLRPEIITAEATNVDPKILAKKLSSKGFNNVVLAGGASIYQMFLQADVIDKLNIVVEPVSFGSGIRLFKEVELQEATSNFDLISEKKLNDQGTILQEWRARGKESR
jgi:dihydrofolate reductase